jgi:hypothetical protein
MSRIEYFLLARERLVHDDIEKSLHAAASLGDS